MPRGSCASHSGARAQQPCRLRRCREVCTGVSTQVARGHGGGGQRAERRAGCDVSVATNVLLAQSEMIAAANWTFLMFPGLSKGAINTIIARDPRPIRRRDARARASVRHAL